MDWLRDFLTPGTAGVLIGILFSTGLPLLAAHFKDKRDLRDRIRDRRMESADKLVKSLAAFQAAVELDGVNAQELFATIKPGETKIAHSLNEMQPRAEAVTAWRQVILQSTNLQEKDTAGSDGSKVLNETFLLALSATRKRGASATDFIPALLNTWIATGKLDIDSLRKAHTSLKS